MMYHVGVRGITQYEILLYYNGTQLKPFKLLLFIRKISAFSIEGKVICTPNIMFRRVLVTSSLVTTTPPPVLFSRVFSALSPREMLSDMMRRLVEKFGDDVSVMDVSGGSGSKYRVEVSSEAFSGKSIVQQHRMVNEALSEPLKTVHAISIKTRKK